MIPSGVLDSTRAFLNLTWTADLPSLGPEKRTQAKNPNEFLPVVDKFCRNYELNDALRQLLRSAALLWHDDLEGSHDISRRIPTADGSLLHGIMHRREPDNSNAKYWFRKTGDHPCYRLMSQTLRKEFNPAEKRPTEKSIKRYLFYDRLNELIPGGRWDPIAFVDACHDALERPADSFDCLALKTIQEVEFNVLIDYWFRNRRPNA